MKNSTEGRKKHVPERTCVACQQVRPKRELVRIVKTADGAVQVDEKGRIAGRGAYLCKLRKCWQEVLKGTRLEHVLRATLAPADRKRLEDYYSTL